jgi:type IV pilus assembly protein PilE
MKQMQQGFTLIELMIAVVVVGILSAIAIPSYRSYVQKAERGAAKAVMLNLAQTEERYFTNNGTYLAFAASPAAAPAGWQNYSGGSSTNVKYTIAVTAGVISATGPTAISDGYTITATPVTMDGLCNILKLDSTGARTISSPAGTAAPTGDIAKCW